MDLTQLLDDDRGVSPVIGVILMVAITVILAAVIGTFVLGLGSNVGNNAPSATFDYNYENFSANASDDRIEITDQGGDSIDTETLNVSVGGDTFYAGPSNDVSPGNTSVDGWGDDTLSAGDTLTIQEEGGDSVGNNEDVQIIWKSSGGSSSIIGSSTTPQ